MGNRKYCSWSQRKRTNKTRLGLQSRWTGTRERKGCNLAALRPLVSADRSPRFAVPRWLFAVLGNKT